MFTVLWGQCLGLFGGVVCPLVRCGVLALLWEWFVGCFVGWVCSVVGSVFGGAVGRGSRAKLAKVNVVVYFVKQKFILSVWPTYYHPSNGISVVIWGFNLAKLSVYLWSKISV